MPSLERDFQRNLIKKIKDRMPDSIVLKNDPDYIQGLPDLTILNGERWGVLECKRSKKAKHQPNQDFYVSKLGAMSFASFVYPENEEEVLDALQRSLES